MSAPPLPVMASPPPIRPAGSPLIVSAPLPPIRMSAYWPPENVWEVVAALLLMVSDLPLSLSTISIVAAAAGRLAPLALNSSMRKDSVASIVLSPSNWISSSWEVLPGRKVSSWSLIAT
jgi:hypothetical protein